MYDRDAEPLQNLYESVEKKVISELSMPAWASKPTYNSLDFSQSPLLQLAKQKMGLSSGEDEGKLNRSDADEANRLYANFLKWAKEKMANRDNRQQNQAQQAPEDQGNYVVDDDPELMDQEPRDPNAPIDIDAEVSDYEEPDAPAELQQGNPDAHALPFPRKDADVKKQKLLQQQNDRGTKRQPRHYRESVEQLDEEVKYQASDLKRFMHRAGYKVTDADIPNGEYTPWQIGKFIKQIIKRDSRRYTRTDDYWRRKADSAYGKANYFRDQNRRYRQQGRKKN